MKVLTAVLLLAAVLIAYRAESSAARADEFARRLCAAVPLVAYPPAADDVERYCRATYGDGR